MRAEILASPSQGSNGGFWYKDNDNGRSKGMLKQSPIPQALAQIWDTSGATGHLALKGGNVPISAFIEAWMIPIVTRDEIHKPPISIDNTSNVLLKQHHLAMWALVYWMMHPHP